MIPRYPDFSNIAIELRQGLHPLYKGLREGISEFTFANLYLFRDTHNYRISKINNLVIITGSDKGDPFFILPFGLPGKDLLDELFGRFVSMKCVSESQSVRFTEMGYLVREDRDNFDYLYLREDLAALHGARYHKKRNLIKAFIENYSYEGKPLIPDYRADALTVLEKWREGREDPGDYYAAREGIEKAEELQLCGGIYYVDGRPAAYTMGEEIALGEAFVIHFEKAAGPYKGLYQFINQSFAAILPKKYKFINREQDLGDEGLRQAKMSYNPFGFVRKYRAWKEGVL